MRHFSCTHCGQRVFFENVRCESCGATLGFDIGSMSMLAFSVRDGGVDSDGQEWTRLGPPAPPMKPCINYVRHQVCNWMLGFDEPTELCMSCLTTRTIPALSKPENHQSWMALERAKRRLIYTLRALRLPVVNKGIDPVNGLCFEFLEDIDPHSRVLTGHEEGVITLNIAEANDAQREKIRLALHEPSRTLLGHFRHESGHYYWDRLIRGSPWLSDFRHMFGDERLDYAQALKAHYASGAVAPPLTHISAYASAHPWEDWAETWAHYLHMVDGLETAQAWGLQLNNGPLDSPTLRPEALALSAPHVHRALIEHWLPVSQFVNAMNRSLGSGDSYPFVISEPVVQKLDFVHHVVRSAQAPR